MKYLILNILILGFTLANAQADEITLRQRQQVIDVIKNLKADLTTYVEELKPSDIPESAEEFEGYREDILRSIAISPLIYDKEVNPTSPITCDKNHTAPIPFTSTKVSSPSDFSNASPTDLEICLNVQLFADYFGNQRIQELKSEVMVKTIWMHFYHVGIRGGGYIFYEIWRDIKEKVHRGFPYPYSSVSTHEQVTWRVVDFLQYENQFDYELSDTERLRLQNFRIYTSNDPSSREEELYAFAERMDAHMIFYKGRIHSKEKTFSSIVKVFMDKDAVQADLEEVIEGLYRWDLPRPY